MDVQGQIILNIIYFFFGYVLGTGTGVYIKSKTNLINEVRLSDFVALTVVLVWMVSMVVDIISPTYETSPLVQGLVGAIVGFFYKQKFDDQNKKV